MYLSAKVFAEHCMWGRVQGMMFFKTFPISIILNGSFSIYYPNSETNYKWMKKLMLHTGCVLYEDKLDIKKFVIEDH